MIWLTGTVDSSYGVKFSVVILQELRIKITQEILSTEFWYPPSIMCSAPWGGGGGGCSVSWRVIMSTMGDIMSTVGDILSTVRILSTVEDTIFCYLSTPTVLMICDVCINSSFPPSFLQLVW